MTMVRTCYFIVIQHLEKFRKDTKHENVVYPVIKSISHLSANLVSLF